MPVTFNEKFLAYLALFSGLVLSVVAEYYSILGLTAIFAAAVIPVIIMGIALGVGKITATLWLKQNWKLAPWTIKIYLLSAIAVLMLVTSMGTFGFLSKAHSDQSLVSGDVLAKISVYDEKIKVAKENIDANRKALKQMDESVDQVMGRSQDEKGADKAVALRRGQAKERTRLLSEITAEQKVIAQLSEERAPIAAEVRKVEAEVGPIKYIAAFVYGNTDQSVLEKAVTWVIIILIVVFDPLAVVLLLSSQISFQNFRERESQQFSEWTEDDFEELANDAWVADVGEKPTQEEKDDFLPTYEEITPKDKPDVISTATVTAQEVAEIIPEAVVVEEAPVEQEVKEPVRTVITGNRPTPKTKIFKSPPQSLTTITEDIVQAQLEEKTHHAITNMGNGYIQVDGQMYHEGSIPPHIQGYIQNEEQQESSVWSKVKKNEE
jgi:hypothetical protein